MRVSTWIAVLFLVVASLLSLDQNLKLQEDSGVYITLAKSLAGGHGYRDLFLVDSPRHTQYPPLLPLLLVPVVYLRGLDFTAMKLVMIALAGITLVLVSALLREITDERKAALVVLLTGTSPAVVYYTQSVMTEIPYLFLSILAIFWIERRVRRTDWTASAIVAAAILLSLVCLTRVTGMALIAATMLYVLVDGAGTPQARLRTAIAVGAMAAIPLALWLLYSSSASAGAGNPYARHYSSSFGAVLSAPSGIEAARVLFGKIRAALYAYGQHTGRLIVYWLPSSRLGNGVALLLAAGVFAGFMHRAMRERTVVEYYVLLYMCALLVYPGSRQQRYMVPLIPFFWLYLLTALGWLFARFRVQPGRERAPLVRVVALGLVLVNALTAVVVNVVQGGVGYYEPAGPDKFRDALAWIKASTAPDSVFMWAKPSLGYVLVERRAVKVPSGPPEVILATLRDRHVDYVVVHPTWKGATPLRRLIEDHPEHVTLAHRDGNVAIYHVNQQTGVLSNRGAPST